MSGKWLKVLFFLIANGSVLAFWGSEYYAEENNDVARQWIFLFAIITLIICQFFFDYLIFYISYYF